MRKEGKEGRKEGREGGKEQERRAIGRGKIARDRSLQRKQDTRDGN